MKTDRIGRAGVLALSVAGLLAVSWVLPPAVHQARRLCPVRPDGVSEAGAYANFARRYGVSCTVCHVSYPQLTEAGYKFRVAGYRMPDEIGNDAKWSNWGDNASVRFSENYNYAATKGNKTSSPETNGFANSGLETYPLEGAFGKYVAANDEVDFTAGKTPTVGQTAGTAGQVSMSTLNMLATVPLTADSFLTTRVGLMSSFQGYGASDRGVGNVAPSFKPTPSQIQPGGPGSFTYPGFGASGEGAEIAYNWKGTHVSAQVVNGYNSFTNSSNQGEDNHFKDLNVFVNQMIGESAIAAAFTSGTSGYGKDTAVTPAGSFAGAEAANSPFTAGWYDNYVRGILYATIKALPADKLDVLLGACDGTDHTFDKRTNSSSDQFHSMGWFATLQSVQHVLAQQLTTALSYGTSRASTATAGNRVSDVTLSFAVPIENNKFGIDFQTKRTQSFTTQDTTANIAQASWTFMF